MKSGGKSLARTTLLRESFSFLFPVPNGLQICEKRRSGEWWGGREHAGCAWMETILQDGCASHGPPYLDFYPH